MPAEESPDAQYERLKRQLQETILREYPNPERKGCPGDGVLRGIAARYGDATAEQDPHWEHVTHCSECYREFLAFRTEMKRAATMRQVGVGVAAAVVIGGLAFFLSRGPEPARPERPQNAELVYRPRLVDLEGRSITRSDEAVQDTKPIVLGRGPEELTVRLPFGSRPGPYEIQLLKAIDKPLLSAGGEARIENGTTSLRARVDLSKFESGNYLLGVRRVPSDWTYYPAVVQ